MLASALAIAMLAAAQPAAAAAAPPASAPAAPSIADRAEDARLLDNATAAIAKGQPADAMTRYLDPLIARLTAGLAAETRRIYAARSLKEMLMYSVLAVGEKRSAVVLGPTLPDAYFWKGFALVDLGRPAEARPLFEKAIELSPMNARYLSELANLHQADKDWAKALELFGKAVAGARAVSPDHLKTRELGRALRGEGYSLIELDRLDEAEARYRECLVLDPNDKMAADELRFVHEKRGNARPVATL